MMRTWGISAALLGLLAMEAAGQNPVRQSADSARTPSRAECDSMVVRARVDSVQTTVRAYLQRIDGGVISSPVVEGDVVYFGGLDGKLYAVSATRQ